MGNEVFTETQEKQIVEVIRATVAEVLRQQEEARATPVVHAKWIPFHSEAAGDIQYCSACEIGFDARMDYCPHCGARMDGWAYDTEPQAHVEAHTERQRKQLEQIRAEQAAEHDDPIRATAAEVLRQQEAQRVTAASDESQAQGTESRCGFFQQFRERLPFLRFPAEKSEDLIRIAQESK